MPSIEWTGETGNWNNASEWNTGAVPNNATTVLINNAGTGAYTVTLNVNASIRALVLNSGNATLNIGNNTLTLCSNTINNNINVANGTLQLAGGTITQNTTTETMLVGASGKVIGFGNINVAITANSNGVIEANGGTLNLEQNIGNNVSNLEIANGSGNTLQIDGAIGATAVNADIITFLGNTGVLDLNNSNTNITNNVEVKLTVGTNTTAVDNDEITFGAATVSSASFNASNDVLTVVTSNGTFALNIAAESGSLTSAHADFNSSVVFLSTQPCYLAGTSILTPEGEVAVEDLVIGDRVMTLSGEPKRIKWIGTRAYDLRFVAGNRGLLPIRIKRGALGNELPQRDLYLSPEHALFIDGMLVPAKALVNGVSIVQEWRGGTVEYYHVELAEHDVIYAEGAAAETYIDCDNRGMFQNEAEFAQLYPADESRPWAYCAPVVDSGPEVDRLRRRIAEYAGPFAAEDVLWRRSAGPLASPAGAVSVKIVRLAAG